MNKMSYYDELIGMIVKNPELLKGDVFDSDVLPKEHKQAYDVIKRCYDKYERFDLGMVTNIAMQLDVFDIMAWSEQVQRYSPIDYKHLKDIIIDLKRQETIGEFYERMNTGMIDVTTFISAVNLYKNSEEGNLKRLTEFEYDRFMAKRDTRIQFHDFKKMGEQHINEGDFVVIAGATGTGKTTLAINLALDLAEAYPIIYVNIELSEDVLIKRMMGSYTNTLMDTIDNRASVPQHELEQMAKFRAFLSERQIYVATGSQTVETIQQMVASFDQDRHFIVIVDHIGRITSDKDSYERMTQTSIAVRNLALDYNCTVFGLCQLNRGFKNEAEPNNGLLRDSGEIEQSARKVMFMWDYHDEENPGANGYYIWFTKNDSGPCRMIPVEFNKETQRIREWTSKG